jgi:hypothetical protein
MNRRAGRTARSEGDVGLLGFIGFHSPCFKPVFNFYVARLKKLRGNNWIAVSGEETTCEDVFFCNPILSAKCTSTFSKLCKNMYTVACRRVFSSTPL